MYKWKMAWGGGGRETPPFTTAMPPFTTAIDNKLSLDNSNQKKKKNGKPVWEEP